MGNANMTVATPATDTPAATLDFRNQPVVDVSEPGLAQVKRRRSELKSAMSALDAALAGLGESAVGQWVTDVRAAVARLVVAFEQHVRLHEGPESFHAEVLRAQPHLASRISRLQRDHVKLRSSLDRLVADVEDAGTEAVDDVRLAAREVLHQFDVHRRRGAALVWEAFNYDLGGEH